MANTCHFDAMRSNCCDSVLHRIVFPNHHRSTVIEFDMSLRQSLIALKRSSAQLWMTGTRSTNAVRIRFFSTSLQYRSITQSCFAVETSVDSSTINANFFPWTSAINYSFNAGLTSEYLSKSLCIFVCAF